MSHNNQTSAVGPRDGASPSWDTDRAHDPTHRLLVRYVIALLLIALMVLTSQFLMQGAFRDRLTDAVGINLAGKQRMLSQRATKAAYALVHSVRLGEASEARRWSAMLGQTTEEWRQMHSALLHGDDAIELAPPSDNVRARLLSIQPKLEAIADRCDRIRSRRRTGAPAEWYTPHVQFIAGHEDEYLRLMDETVKLMVQENEAKVMATSRLEALLAAAALFILCLEVLLVFEPARRALRKQMEGMRAAYRAARDSERVKQDFLANMSHEIRTPMNAIVGYSNVLADDGASDALKQESVASLQRNADHLLQIINNVLDVAKINNGVDVVRPHPTHIADLLLDIPDLLAESGRSKGLELSVDLDTPIPRTVLTDSARMRQILVNLVGNAIKYTDDGRVDVRARRQDNSLIIDVRDTGIGIAPEELERLFDPFTQAHTGTTRRFGGTGLGLAISRQLAHALGGELTAVSQPTSGSVFTLRLPVGVTEDSARIDRLERSCPKRAPEPDAPSPLSASVLLVEDGADNRKLITFCLERLGLDVDTAENGKLGLAKVLERRDAGRPFDLIFMDMQMPVMDGYTATTELRRNNIRTPIIALTAHAMNGDRERCIAAGCDDYVTKPVTRERLAEVVDQWAGPQRTSAAA